MALTFLNISHLLFKRAVPSSPPAPRPHHSVVIVIGFLCLPWWLVLLSLHVVVGHWCCLCELLSVLTLIFRLLAPLWMSKLGSMSVLDPAVEEGGSIGQEAGLPGWWKRPFLSPQQMEPPHDSTPGVVWSPGKSPKSCIPGETPQSQASWAPPVNQFRALYYKHQKPVLANLIQNGVY